jgi:hypothetical protein
MAKRKQLLVVAAMVTAAASLVAAQAGAATYTWTQVTSGTQNWSSAANWDVNGVPVSATDTILNYYPNTSTGPTQGVTVTSTNDLASPPFVLNKLNIRGTTTTGGSNALIVIAGSGIAFGGTSPAVDFAPGYGTGSGTAYSITAPLTFNADTTVTFQNTGGQLFFNGQLNGSGKLTVNNLASSRNVVFRYDPQPSASTFTGDVVIQGNRTVLQRRDNLFGSNSAGAGNQAVTVSNGASLLLDAGNAAWTQSQNFVLNGAGDGSGALQITGINFGNYNLPGGIAVATDSTVRVVKDGSSGFGRGVNVSKPLVGSGKLTKTGTDFLFLNGGQANAGDAFTSVTWGGTTYGQFSGDVAVNAGVIQFASRHNVLGKNTAGTQVVTIATGAAVVFNDGNGAYASQQNFVINGSGTGQTGQNGAAAALQLNGVNFGDHGIRGLAVASNSTISLNRDGSAADTRGLRLSGPLAGTGNLTLTAVTAGTNTSTLYLTQAAGTVDAYSAYSGTITVNTGRLQVETDKALGAGSVVLAGDGKLVLTGGTTKDYFDNLAGTLTIPSGMASGSVNLNFVGTDILRGITLNGTSYTSGTFGAVGSAATIQNAVFTGTGLLQVVVPEPTTLASLAIIGLTALKRRR